LISNRCKKNWWK